MTNFIRDLECTQYEYIPHNIVYLYSKLVKIRSLNHLVKRCGPLPHLWISHTIVFITIYGSHYVIYISELSFLGSFMRLVLACGRGGALDQALRGGYHYQ